MNFKQLSKIADANLKSEKNYPFSDEAFALVKEVLKRDILAKVQTEVSWAGAADRPGEYVSWGPASKYQEVLKNARDAEDALYSYMDDDPEMLADVLGVDEDDLGDVEVTEEIEKKIYSLLTPDPSELKKGKYALVVFDWNNRNEFIKNGTVSEEELIDFLLEGESYGYSECPWGLYQCMLLCGLDPEKFTYLNSNDESSIIPTTESVSEEVEAKVREMVESGDSEEHYFYWKQGL